MRLLNLYDSMKILQKYKIITPKLKLTRNIKQAVKVAKEIGYPVAIKMVSSVITHKTEVGGVYLNISNEAQLTDAYGKILENVRKITPKTKIDGILVQKMIQNGQEVIIGCKKDKQFGHVMIFGLGGIFTELFNDVALRTIPINNTDVDEMIKEIKAYKILFGYRGKKYDVDSLKQILLKVSSLVKDKPKITELDINPVIVSNKGAIAVDARIIME